MANPTPTAMAVRVPVDVRRLRSFRRLAADYAHDFPRLASFFAGNPAEPGAWTAAIERVRHATRPRAEIAGAIVEQQRRYRAPQAAVDAAGKLADAGTIAIVTGQQAGLFGGPLYTLLKAVTAVKLAEEVGRTHRVAAVPVFWIESEDHDWDEVATCTVLDADLEPRQLTLPALPGANLIPVARVNLDSAAGPVLQALREALPATEFTDELLDHLAAAYAQDITMSAAFARWMSRVLGPRGLVVYDASAPATKRFVRDLFVAEIREPGRTVAIANRAGQELIARGYHAQVTAAEGSVALFHLDGQREPIQHSADGFRVGDANRTADDLLREVNERPAAFSPNVLLRPLVQDTLFPTAAYVAGPNELAYLGQLRGVYEHLGVPMPLMVPRASATLVDSAAFRFLSKVDLDFEALARDDEAALNRLLEQQLPPTVENAWRDADRELSARMEALVQALPAIDPTLQGAARSALGRMKHDLDVLHDKIVQAAKRRDETLRRQFTRTRAMAFPGGEPQERVVGFVYFWNRYGPALVERLLAELPLDPGQHWIVSI